MSPKRQQPACGRKRRHSSDSDAEEEPQSLKSKSGLLTEQPIENEYEDIDDGQDEDDDDDDGDDGDDGDDSRPDKDQRRADRKREYEEMLEAQESSTLAGYGDIKLTPFNLKEELEEGEFDATGNFIFRRTTKNKSDDEDRDNWADSVDWKEVERKPEQNRSQAPASSAMQVDEHPQSTTPDEEPPRDKVATYKQMLRLLKPDETVQRAIRRLGNLVPRNRPRKSSKATTSCQSAPQTEEAIQAAKNLGLLIEFAHQRLEEGEMDIYQKSYEDLEEEIN